MSPLFQETDFIAELAKDGILMEAWFPLGHADKSLIEEEIFTRLAAKYRKSNVQIILRWHIQAGHIVIPGSRNPEHIRSNMDIFDFELTDDEMRGIAALNKDKHYFKMPKIMQRIMFTGMKVDFDNQP